MSLQQAWLLPALPAIAALLQLLVGRHLPRRGSWLACGATGASLLLALMLVDAAHEPTAWGAGDAAHVLAPLGRFTVLAGTHVDALAATLVLMVCAVGFLVQVYSVAYLADDARYPSYSAFVSLFTAAMLLVVLSADLVELLVGWELMGICSYFLIGHHWEERVSTDSAISAFLVTRFADLSFTAGIFVLGTGARSFRISEVLAHDYSRPTLTTASLLLLVGVIGKSAQFPLQTWLPDAMAGPTPISALIHAATMVAAGVYVVARLYPVVAATSAPLDVLAAVASVSMVFGALCALAHDDVKKVLAWSTVSQLGYMYAGLAVGGYGAGLFHLLTHAAFKALLFLAAGCLIHAVGINSMAAMGGLRRAMPLTFVTTTVGLGALAGVPPLSGFFSKDGVIDAAWSAVGGDAASVPVSPVAAGLVALCGVVTALLTAAYVTRLWLLVFAGERRSDAVAHEPSWLMRLPLVVLAVPAAGLGLAALGGQGSLVAAWLGGERRGALGFFSDRPISAGFRVPASTHVELSTAVSVVTTAAAFVGVIAVLVVWRRDRAADPALVLGRARPVLQQGFYVDELYRRVFVRPTRHLVSAAVARFDSRVVDGAVDASGQGARGVGGLLQLTQRGNAQAYATIALAGAVVIGLAVAAL